MTRASSGAARGATSAIVRVTAGGSIHVRYPRADGRQGTLAAAPTTLGALGPRAP